MILGCLPIFPCYVVGFWLTEKLLEEDNFGMSDTESSDFGLVCDDRPGEDPLDVLEAGMWDELEKLAVKGNDLTVLEGEGRLRLEEHFASRPYADVPIIWSKV